MAPINLSVIVKPPQFSKNFVTTVLKATITAPISILQKDKRIKTSFTQYGSQSSTTFYPKRTYATSSGENSMKATRFDADLKVVGTIQESPSPVHFPTFDINGDNKLPQVTLKKISEYLSAFLELQSIKTMNQHRWSDLEKCLLKQKLLSMDKKLNEFTWDDYRDLSKAVPSRSTRQCYDQIRYHYK